MTDIDFDQHTYTAQHILYTQTMSTQTSSYKYVHKKTISAEFPVSVVGDDS